MIVTVAYRGGAGGRFAPGGTLRGAAKRGKEKRKKKKERKRKKKKRKKKEKWEKHVIAVKLKCNYVTIVTSCLRPPYAPIT